MWSSCDGSFRIALRHILPDEKSLPDEREIVKAQDQDVNILISVDAIQANDELLFTAMVEAFHYGQPSWMDAVDFVMQILAHRLPTVAESDRVLLEWPFYDAFPLRSLRPQVIEEITKILSAHVIESGSNVYRSVLPTDAGDLQSGNECVLTEDQRMESTRFLCMTALSVAAVDVSRDSITSDLGLLGIFQRLFGNSYSSTIPLFKDWVRIAMGKKTTRNDLPSSPATQPAAQLLRLITSFIGPVNIALYKGILLVEGLTGTDIDDWGRTIEWNALPIDSDYAYRYELGPSESFLQALLLSEFQQCVSPELADRATGYYPSMSLTVPVAGRVLSVILRSALQEQSYGPEQYLRRQGTFLEWLARIVELATRSESCTAYFIGVLLDHGGPDGHPNSIILIQLLDTYDIVTRIRDASALSQVRLSGQYSESAAESKDSMD